MGNRRKKRPVSVAGNNGKIEIEFTQVPDPYEPGKMLDVAKNVRVHPLDALRARDRINDAQKAAGDRFLAIYDRAEIGGARAIDYSRVKVDVSFEHRGLDPGVAVATDELIAIRRQIGKRPYALLCRVIGERISLRTMASAVDAHDRQLKHLDWPSRDTVSHMYRSLQEALDDLADHFGVAKGVEKSTIRAYDEERGLTYAQPRAYK